MRRREFPHRSRGRRRPRSAGEESNRGRKNDHEHNCFVMKLVHQVSDWCSGAAANFDWMREAKRENTRCGL